MAIGVVRLPYHAHACKEKNDKKLEHEYLEEHLIHGFHDITHLSWLILLILHNLSFSSHIYWNTVDVITVAKGGPSKTKLLYVNLEDFFKLWRLYVGVPFFEVFIRRIAMNFPV
jgi:hypothetical protein